MAWKEKEFEEKMTPAIDAIYRQLFGRRLVSIYRSSRKQEQDSKLLFMDIELAIDTHLRFDNGGTLTFQEKTLRASNAHYNQFTFEYYNDPKTKDPGEWFKLAAQLYFFGYANAEETGYLRYWILNVARLRTGLMRRFTMAELETKRYLKQNPPPAKANFFAIPFEDIEKMEGVILVKRESG
jgi:hypothetical protein